MIFNLELITQIKKNILVYHTIFDKIDLKGEYWESILDKSFNDLNIKSEWYENSHKIGIDILTDDFGRISCKGGILYTKKLVISGSRTTSHPTLEDKIKFLDDKKVDTYFCLAKKKPFDGKYHLYIFNSDCLDHSSMMWENTYRGYKGTVEDFTILIESKMSDQIWYHINKNLLPEPFIIDISEPI
jgi:hypothetical protein